MIILQKYNNPLNFTKGLDGKTFWAGGHYSTQTPNKQFDKNISRSTESMKKDITFEIPTFDLHVFNNANDVFLFDSNITYNNTPPMPLNDAHLGGFFI